MRYLGLEGSWITRQREIARLEHEGLAACPVLAVHAEARLVAIVACAGHGTAELNLFTVHRSVGAVII